MVDTNKIKKIFNDWKKWYETNVILLNKKDDMDTTIFNYLSTKEKMTLLEMIEAYKIQRAKEFLFISVN